MLEEPTFETFRHHLNTRFRIHDETSNVVEVELIEVKNTSSSTGEESFSIVFRGPHSPPLRQQIVGIDHDEMGTLDLFIVPVGKDEDGLYYEAVFNRLRP